MSAFLRAIYEEKLQMTETQLHKAATMSGINLLSYEYRVLILSCQHAIATSQDYQRYCIDMTQQCENFFDKKQIRAAVETDYMGKCVILLMDHTHNKDVEKSASALIAYMDACRFSHAIISVGKRVFSVVDIAQSYRTALQAINYQSLYSGERCLFCDDMQTMLHLFTLKSVVDPGRMLQAFQEDKMTELRLLVTSYAEKVRAISGSSVEGRHPTSIRRMFVELTVYVLHMASDIGVNVDELLHGIDPYNYFLFEEKATPDMIDWFMNLCIKLREAINYKTLNKERTLIQQVCAYIDDHIMQYNLSLDDVSSAVGISPSYLSRLFHKEMDIGFSKYIVLQRINLAIQLLQETDLPVREIATRTGFSSANYFGTVFRRIKGVSPSQYREVQRNSTQNIVSSKIV